ILRRLTLDQQAFAMANEPLFELLDLWLKDGRNSGREVTTGRLYVELGQLAAESLLPNPFRSPQEFGRKIDDFQSTLESVYGMKIRSGRSGTRLIELYPSKLADAA